MLLITHYPFGPATAIFTTAMVAVASALIWFAVPLRRRRLQPPPRALTGAQRELTRLLAAPVPASRGALGALVLVVAHAPT